MLISFIYMKNCCWHDFKVFVPAAITEPIISDNAIRIGKFILKFDCSAGVINPLQFGVAYLYPLKSPENL